MFNKLKKMESGSLKAAAEILERLENDNKKMQNVRNRNRSAEQQKQAGILPTMRRKAQGFSSESVRNRTETTGGGKNTAERASVQR